VLATTQSSPWRRRFLERVRQVLDPPGPLGDHIEANVEPSELLVAGEPAEAARRTRATFRASTISNGSPNPSPLLDFTSQNTRTRPRRAITSSSAPASQQFVSRIR
jgi:hypothetical protein